jgi:hypothetical protein
MKVCISLFSLITAVVAYGLPIGCQNDRVTSTITDGCQVTSIQNETFSFVLTDEWRNWLVNPWRDVLLPLHGKFLPVMVNLGVIVGGLRIWWIYP